MIFKVQDTIIQNIVYVKNETSEIPFRELAKLANLSKSKNIVFKNFERLFNLSSKDIKDLTYSLRTKFGCYMFDKFITNENYGQDEYIKTLLMYFNTYSGFYENPENWLSDILLYPKDLKESDFPRDIKKCERIIEVKTFEDLKNDLDKVLVQENNPTMFDYVILDSFELFYKNKLLDKQCNNKQVYEHILYKNSLQYWKEVHLVYGFKTLNFFKIFVEGLPKSTSTKKFIMKIFNTFDLNKIKDELRPQRNFWLRLEKTICTQQKKYNKFRNAQYIFRELINNNLNSFGQRIKDLENSEFSANESSKLIRHLFEIYTKNKSLIQVIDFKNIKLKTLFEILNALELRYKCENRFTRLQDGIFIQKNDKINTKMYNELKSLILDKIKTKLSLKDLDCFRNCETFPDPRNLLICDDSQKRHVLQDLQGNEKTLLYIDNLFKDIKMPLNVKEMAISDTFLTRGSVIRIPEKLEKIRVFLAWKSKDNKARNIDLDLSAIDTLTKENLSFTNLKSSYGKHSGDFTSCKAFNPEDGIITAEFLDIDLDKVQNLEISTHSYSGQSFDKMDAYFGICLSTKDKIVNLNNVIFTMKLTGSGGKFIGFNMFKNLDKCVNLEIISEFSKPEFGSKVEDNVLGFYQNYYRNIVNIYDFFKLYGLEITQDKDKAKYIIDFDTIKNFDFNTFLN